jgi:hypothetical protein
VLGWKSGPQKVIGTRVIRTKRGVQWDRWKIRVSRKGLGPWGKKGLKVKGTTASRMKRGIQWTRSQIRVWWAPYFFFFFLLLWSYTPALNTSAVGIPKFSIIKNVGRECFCSEKFSRGQVAL